MNIRRSLHKHAFGTAKTKPEQMLTGLKPIFKADTVIKGNATFFAIPWDSAGGSCLAVFPVDKTGRMDARNPVRTVRGHSGPVLDFDFDPYDDHILATGCDDTLVRIFEIPQGGLGDSDLEEPLVTLAGHERKVTHVLYHPTAKNVIASASQDNTLRVWDAVAGEAKVIVEHPDQIYAVTWNYDGSLIATTCRDKKLRVIDARTGNIVKTADDCHMSAKPTRVCWLGNRGRILTTGFSKQGEREHAMWDAKELSLMHRETLELSPSQLQPFFDEDTGVIYLAGKGEAKMRYLEVIDEAPYTFALSEYSGNPCKGLALLPKRVVNVKECEIARFLMLTRDSVERVHFTVPRKAATFQSDIFPDTRDFAEAPNDAEGFFGGKDVAPKLVSMAPEGGSGGPAKSATSRLAASSRLGRASNASATSQPAEAVTAPKGASNEEKIAALTLENERQAKVIADLEATLKTVKVQVEDQAKKIKELSS